jgi:hypothetical protein
MAHMFGTEKKRADGSFDRYKERLVADGRYMDTMMVGDIHSPTVNQIFVMTLLYLSVGLNLERVTEDIKAAFLYSEMKEKDPPIYIWVDKDTTEIFIKLYPKMSEYRRKDGRMLLKLKRYLYGLPQASRQFNNHHGKTGIYYNTRGQLFMETRRYLGLSNLCMCTCR